MGDSLSKSLSQFISNNMENQFDNPFEDNEEEISRASEFKSVIDRSDELKEERKKKRKKDKFSKVIDKGNELIDEFMDDDLIDDFDGFVGNFLLDDEDVDLRRNLLRYGRKYTRDTKVSGESSEISKAYSESEKLLSELLKEIDQDKELVQNDITNMRMMRTRNYKTLSDLIESKAQFHNTALSVIKEMNAMKKNQIELQMKVDKTKKEDAEDDSASNKAIQQLFGLGRDNLLGGGYEEISGANEAGLEESSENSSTDFDEDEYIQKKYFSSEDDDYGESDGDKFLKYEGMGARYILLIDDDGNKQIIVEDNDGNIIPDYPVPGEPSDLSFDISESTGTATDNLANQYELRRI